MFTDMFIENAGCRWVIAVMIFANSCINYMMRVNISVNIVAMVPVSNTSYDSSQVTLDWTPYQRANILSAYFWGYLASNPVSGLFVERYGSSIVALIMVAVAAVLTFLSPFAAKYSYVLILIVRIAIGLCSGFLFPAMFALVGTWAVPNERGKFLGAIIAGTIGTFITWTLCGIIIEVFGWEWGFYTFGIIALFWCIPWWFLVYNSPDMHPRISPIEKKYINDGTKQMKKETHFPPYRKMLTSLSVWSLLILSFGSGWGIYFVITAAPNYLSNALSYKISATGALSGVIYLCRSVASFVFGATGDILIKRNILSLSALRRLGTIGSHIIPGCLLLCMAVSGLSPLVYVILITLAMTLNAQVTVSCIANSYDLTSNFVASLTSLTVAMTTLAGVILPFVTAHFTKYKEIEPEAWKPVFYTGSFVFILSGLQFVIFGTTKKLAWDIIVTEPTKETFECVRL